MADKRGSFSRIGFILAAAGSAVGLGNLWRFPYTVGHNGGGVFVLIYLLAVVIIAVPVLIAEVTLGRHTRKNPVGAFNYIKPGSQWKLVGFLGVITGFMILSYYSVIAGWTVGYFVKAVAGSFRHITSVQAAESFSTFTSNWWMMTALLAFFIFLTVYIVSKGVAGGIEKYSRILMPILLGILLLLLVRSVTLKGASKGVAFYLKPDLGAISPKLVIQAIGQALFSLSLGMGTMITYGSYVDKKENLPSSAAWIVIFNTVISITAGFIIFPAIFSQGMSPDQGSGVMFNTLPVLFSKMPAGAFFGPLFFLILGIAALTSTISILEVPVAYFIDEKKIDRKKISIIIGVIAFLIGIPSALSQGAVGFFTDIPLIHIGFLDLMNHIWGNLSLSIGAFFVAVFVGHIWKSSNALEEIKSGCARFSISGVWSFTIKYVAPVVIILILFGVLV
ncbi:sodium-dependent transporter [bacterium]|nr:sodium-dependent transporter [bacterium]